MMGRRKMVFLLSLLFLVLVCSGWFWYQQTIFPLGKIRIASGKKGGEYYNVGQELARTLRVRTGRSVENIETAGTMENLRRLQAGEVQIALLQSIAFQDPEIEEGSDLAVIAPLYLEPVVIMVRKESSIASLTDLQNKRVCTGPKESGTARTSDDLFDFYGLNKVQRIPAFFHSNDPRDTKNECDAGVLVMGLHSPGFKEMGATGAYRILELPYTQALAASKAFLGEVTLPEGVFARHPLPTLPNTNTQTIAFTALLAVDLDTPSDLINNLLDAIYLSDLRVKFSNIFPLQEAREWAEIPLHLASQEYYNPLRRMESFANRMESCAAVKELFFALLAAFYFFWLRFNDLRKKKEIRIVHQMKEELDSFLQITIALDRKQMASLSLEELQNIIDQITQLKIQALEDLTDEKLRSDQMFSIFLMQCHNVISKTQTKMLILRQSGQHSEKNREGQMAVPGEKKEIKRPFSWSVRGPLK